MDHITIIKEYNAIQRKFDSMGNSYSQSNPGVMMERAAMRRRQRILYEMLHVKPEVKPMSLLSAESP